MFRTIPDRAALAGAIAAAFFVAGLLTGSALAQDDADKAKKEYRRIQTQIKKEESRLKKAEKAEATTLSSIDGVNKKLQSVRGDLQASRRKLRRTEAQIKQVKGDIPVLEARLKRHREWMSRKLRAMQRYGKYGDLILVLGASEDASQLMRRWRYLEVLAGAEREAIDDFRETLKALQERKARLESLHAQLAADQKRTKSLEAGLAKERKRKKRLLASVKQEKKSYEKLLKELNASSNKLLDIIKEAERTKRFASKDFRKLKGRLPWPVGGRVAIPYGTTRDPEFKTPVFRNGIYIASKPESIAKAVHAGRVVYADWFKGYGQLVIINHGGGYHTLYANLQEIFLREGDIIKERVDIGKVGESGVAERTSLYFEIRYKGKPLNPTQWLLRR